MGRIIQTSKPSENKYPALKRSDELVATNLGGKFALPVGFDTTKHAAALVPEGNEVLARQATEQVIGTPYVAEGWEVWKYPEGHPLAGESHKVTGTKTGENFVLMFRPIEVQEQVNQAYGELSIKQMSAEVKGETISVPGADQDPGMLSEERLSREIGGEVERDEELGRTTAVHGMSTATRISRQPQKVAR